MTEEPSEPEDVNAVTEEIVQETPRAPQDNPLFKTLFEVGDEVGEEDAPEAETEPDASVPMTLSEAVEDIGNPEEEVVEEIAEAAPESPEAQPEEVEKGSPKKKKLRKVVDPEIPDDLKPTAEYNFSDEDEEEVDPDLLPAEQEVYKMARYASRNMTEHQGLDKKFKDFFAKSKSYLDKRIEDDPHFDLEDDHEYGEFMDKNRPKVSQTELKKIEKTMWIDEAKREARKELVPEQEKLRKEIERSKKAPHVNHAKNSFRQMSQKVVIPSELNEKFSQPNGIQEYQKENPLEFKIIEQATGELLSAGDTLTDILMSNVDLDTSNPVHKSLLEWVNTEQDSFINSGQTEQDGKLFMRRERFFTLPANKQSEYYTWSDDDLLKILALRSKEKVSAQLEHQRKILEESGYVKANQGTAQPEPTQPVAPQAQPVAPKVPTTPRQGGVIKKATPEKQNNALLNVLGF